MTLIDQMDTLPLGSSGKEFLMPVDLTSSLVRLNVGGALFDTTVATLTKFPDTMLARMLSGAFPVQHDADSRVFVDRDGALFGDVLRFLRDGIVVRTRAKDLEALLLEARYYCLDEMVADVSAALEALQEQDRRQSGALPELLASINESLKCGRRWGLTRAQHIQLRRLSSQSIVEVVNQRLFRRGVASERVFEIRLVDEDGAPEYEAALVALYGIALED